MKSIFNCKPSNVLEHFPLPALVLLWSILLLPTSAHSDLSDPPLTDLSLEQLMDIEVSVASKKIQHLADIASAIFVITHDDIRRSGVTSIPEALRMVPGVQVARLDRNKWAITARGFNDRFANKLLVLMDGRSVYTPLFSGVFWNMQDTLIEDIDRIEVIRGPGASVWGANAVNGVINIITKNAADTQGGLVTTALGNEESYGGVRFGGRYNQALAYRIFAKASRFDDGVDPSGGTGADAWTSYRTGFRMDSQDRIDTYTLQGDLFYGELMERIVLPQLTPPYMSTEDDTFHISGGNLLGRWQHSFSNISQLTIQAYLDHSDHTTAILDIVNNTLDLELRHQFQAMNSHAVIWGIGFRYNKDHIHNSFTTSVEPSNRSDALYSAFIQDEITLVPEMLTLTLGSKFEHNDYTGMEIQPSGRIILTPAEGHVLWGAVSRAVRTPSRIEHDGGVVDMVLPPNALFPGSPVTAVAAFGNSDFESEKLLSYELGYRTWPVTELTLDLAAYYNEYKDLSTLEQTGSFIDPTPMPHNVVALEVGNLMEGRSYGVELAADWQPFDWWRFRTAYAYEQINLRTTSESTDTSSDSEENRTPHHQLSIRSQMDLSPTVELDMWFRYTDDLPEADVDDFTTLDVRLGWQARPDLELAIVGQNLLQDHHLEYAEPFLVDTVPSEIERSVYGKITWRF